MAEGREVGMSERQTKITFGEMRSSGGRGVLVYCADYHCSHFTAMDDVRLSDIENQFKCKACGRRGADVRPDWPQAKMGSPQ
jgi:hypothetical protein